VLGLFVPMRLRKLSPHHVKYLQRHRAEFVRRAPLK
jgi:hypothetical protein